MLLHKAVGMAVGRAVGMAVGTRYIAGTLDKRAEWAMQDM